jgi:transcriptional regulator with XRE-family HTH domain
MDNPSYYTNVAFGEAVGCHHSMASRIVNGKRLPSVELMERISAAYGVSMEEMLDARRKGAPSFGRLMQRRIVREMDRQAAAARRGDQKVSA